MPWFGSKKDVVAEKAQATANKRGEQKAEVGGLVKKGLLPSGADKPFDRAIEHNQRRADKLKGK